MAEFLEGVGGAGAFVAEAEVVSFDDDGGAEAFADVADEAVGWCGEEVGGGLELVCFVDAEGFEEAGALVEGGEWFGRVIGGEDGGGVRVEGEGDDAAFGADGEACAADEFGVAEVGAVEVADGEGGERAGVVGLGAGLWMWGRGGHGW